jgi:hypothetical protein
VLSRKILTSKTAKFFLLAAVVGATSSAFCQEFPDFPVGTGNSSSILEYGVGIAAYGSSYYPGALFATYVDQGNSLNSAFSLNGSTYQDQGIMLDHVSGKAFNVNCRQAATCSPAVAVFKGVAYIAYPDQNTLGLDVVEVTEIPGNTGWYYQTVYTDTSVQLTSAPGMAVAPDGKHLILRYGTSNVPNESNGTYTTEFDGTTWSTYPSGGLAPTQSALVSFGGNLYAIDKQDNSDNGVFVSKLSDSGVVISGSSYQVPGWYTKAGISAVVFKNNIVATFQQDASSDYLWVYSTPDGQNWSGKEYTNIQIGGTPSVALYNGGIVTAFIAQASHDWLFSSFATQ